MRCWFCNKRGHKQNDCWLRRKGRKGGGRERFSGQYSTPVGQNRNATATLTAGSVSALVTRLGKLSRYPTCRRPKAGWIIDSGASHHMCNDHTVFDSIQHLRKPIKVHIGDGSFLLATASGIIRIELEPYTIELSVLYVPKLKYCLLSVSRLSSAYQLSFQDNACYLIPRSSNNYTQVVLGCLVDGLYVLRTDCLSKPSGRSTAIVAQSHPTTRVPLGLWH